MSSTIWNGDSRSVSIDTGKKLSVVAVSGTYTVLTTAGIGAGTALATNATGGTYGPYAGPITVLLTSSALSEVDYDVAVTPVIVSDTVITESIDPLTGVISFLIGSGAFAGPEVLAFPFDSDGLDAAVARIVATGNPGTVRLAPVDYSITRDHTLVSGISYVGTPNVPVVTGNVPDFWTPGLGTRFNLAAGVTGFKWNNVDKGSTESPNIMDFALRGVRLFGITFIGGLRAIDIGAYLAMGALFSEIDEIFAYNQTGDYSIDIKNSQFFRQGRIRVRTTLTTGGGYRFANRLDTNLYTGDSHIDEIFCRRDNPLNRGVVFEASGPSGCLLNDVKVTGRIHSSNYDSANPHVISMAFTNTSADIVVADNAQYALCQLGMPVRFATTAPTNYDPTIVYFVVYRNDGTNTIRLGEADYSATTGTASGSTASYNGQITGFPAFMARANSGNAVKNCDFGDIACEVTSNVVSLVFSKTRNCFARVNNPSTSLAASATSGTGFLFRDAEMSIDYAGASNITTDESSLYGYVNFRNGAGGPVHYTGGSVTVDSSWNGRDIRYSGTTDITVTLPNNLPHGFEMTWMPTGATGIITFAAAASGAIFSKSSFKRTVGQYSAAQLKMVTKRTWALTGDLQA